MAQFSNLSLTAKGLALQTKAQTGVQLNFTKVQFGDGSLANGETIANLTALKSPKMTTTIASNTVIGDGTSQIRTILNNSNLVAGFYLREVGVFAQDPDEGEILYEYAMAGEYADYIPAGTGNSVFESTLDLIAIIGNASNVSATIQSGAYTSQLDFEERNAESTGYGVISGGEVTAQATPNMTVNVSTINADLPSGKKATQNQNVVQIDTSDATKPRTDIVYVKSDGTIGYLKSGLGTGAVAGKETYTIGTNAVGAIAGSNTYTVGTNFVANDTVEFDGVTFTAVASGATGNQFDVGTDIATSATNLANALNANTTINVLYNISASNGVITITEKTAGARNTPGSMTVTGTGKITVGTATTSKSADTVTINGITFTAVGSNASGNEFNIGADTTATATNLASVLNSNTTINSKFTATSSSNIVTLTEKTAGGGHTPTTSSTTGTVIITNGTVINSTVQIYPSAPTTPDGGMLLSQIAVGAGATNIVQSNITDKRIFKLNNNQLGTQMADIPNQVYITEKAKQVDLDSANVKVATNTADINSLKSDKADTSYVDTKVATVASGAPDKTYATLADLNTAYPTGDSKNKLVASDGHIYNWNGSSWTDTGIQYQSTGIGEGTVTPSATTFKKQSGVNLFNKDTITIGECCSGYNGTLYTASALNPSQITADENNNYGVSDFIEVDDNQYYCFTYDSDSKLTKWCGYDENHAFVKGGGSPSFTTDGTFKYIRFNVYIPQIDIFMIRKTNTYVSSEYTPYYYLDIKEEYLPTDVQEKLSLLDGLKGTYLFSGDSICYGADYVGGYAKLLGDNNPDATVINYGISGTTIAVRTGYTNSILERLTTMQNTADYVVFEGGVNDAWDSVPLGSFVIDSSETTYGVTESMYDSTTFTGALELLFLRAFNKWNNAKIFFIIPHRLDPIKTSTYMERAKDVCKKWNVICIDLRELSGLNALYNSSIKSAYTIGDGVHPNENGYRNYYIKPITNILRIYQ